MEYYGIELNKIFKFSSSHFHITKDDRQAIHSHNFRVSLKIITKNINEHKYCIDFGYAKKILKEITDSLKQITLIPTNNEYLAITKEQKDNIDYYIIKTEDGAYFQLPVIDVKLIEVNQTSCECLAKHIFEEFNKKLTKEMIKDTIITKIQVKVFHNEDECGIFSKRFE